MDYKASIAAAVKAVLPSTVQGGTMRIQSYATYEEMSKAAARYMAAQLLLKPDSVIGLATGSTPIGMYKELIKMNEAGEIDFSNVVT
ncbi:MAG: hypothetical protein GX028_10405, partial [Clostridiaceae bacterium]|nr:hypothetical protein [Clostridiaceae bacterium]